MSQAPKNQPTNRLIHNVDLAWKQTAKYTITTVVGRETEALRFLHNMIPEFLHRFGEDATKWFTSAGLIIYKDIKWNPTKGKTTSSKEHESEEMVNEDPWDLRTQWEQIASKPNDTSRPEATGLDRSPESTSPDTPPDKAMTSTDTSIEHTRLASDKSIASFGTLYQREKDSDDVTEAAKAEKEAAEKITEITGTQFEFSTDQIERDQEKALHGPMSTGMSMSTAAKTTNSTRLKLKEAQEEIGALRLALEQQKLSPRHETPSHENTNQALTVNTASNINTPETMDQQSISDEDNDTKELGSHLIQHITDAQVLGARLAKKHRQALQAERALSDKDEKPSPFMGSLTSSEESKLSSSDKSKNNHDMETEEPIEEAIIDISSTSSTTTSSSSSESSTSESSSATSDTQSKTGTSSADNDSVASLDTQQLVRRVKKHQELNRQHKEAQKTITKNPTQPEDTTGAPVASDDLRTLGRNSGSERAHSLTTDPSGGAGDLHKVAGHGV
jgi:hypothetical protein